MMMGTPDDCPFAIVNDKSEYVRKLVQGNHHLERTGAGAEERAAGRASWRGAAAAACPARQPL